MYEKATVLGIQKAERVKEVQMTNSIGEIGEP